MFFFFDNKIDIEKVKDITKRIVEFKFVDGKALTDVAKELGEEIRDASFDMFSMKKLDTKTFSVCNNSFLRKIRIEEDDDGIPEKDIPKVNEFFKNNTTAFHELVSKICFPKISIKTNNNNHLFYVTLKSKFSSENEDLYLVKRHNKFMVFIHDLTNIIMEDYITDYFGNINHEILCELEELRVDTILSHEDMQNKLSEIFEKISITMEKGHKFIKGAITFFDFLGWKGLWHNNREDHLEKVSDLIDKFKVKLKEETSLLFPLSNGIDISRLISISDTIAIFTPKTSTVSENQILELHAKLAQHILQESTKCCYPIRGSISYGEYSVMNNIMIGPGIDECASWHEKSDWIGTHFTPSAQFILKDGFDSNLINDNFPIPLKIGIPKVKYCVKWYIEDIYFKNLLDNVKALLPELSSKYLNTFEFLQKMKKERVNS